MLSRKQPKSQELKAQQKIYLPSDSSKRSKESRVFYSLIELLNRFTVSQKEFERLMRGKTFVNTT